MTKSKYKSIQDPSFKDMILVKASDGDKEWAKLAGIVLQDIKDNTYYRLNKKTNDVKCMVTILPDGSHVAWVMCANCGQHMFHCNCAGMIQPAYITYYYSKARHTVYGEALMTTNEIYEISPKYPVGTERLKHSVKKKSGSLFPNMQPPVRGKSHRATSTNSRGKKITKPVVDNSAGMSIRDIENIDISSINDMANQMANDGIASVSNLKPLKTKKVK